MDIGIEYVPIPGQWARKEYPHWPDTAFQAPDEAPPKGKVYYVTKGHLIRLGGTAMIERLSSGDIAKSPLQNLYHPTEEQENFQKMQREIEIYRLLGPSQFTPRLVDCDTKSCILTLDYQANGDLETYVHEHQVDADTRQKWTLQAAAGLSYVHRAGVVHTDLTPRNLLVDADCNLRISDFAGSLLQGKSAFTGSLLQGQSIFAGSPGARYQSQHWSQNYIPTVKDDIFALGSVIYFIATGQEPYSNLTEREVLRNFQKQMFPETGQLFAGSIIRRCWHGEFYSADAVMSALETVVGEGM